MQPLDALQMAAELLIPSDRSDQSTSKCSFPSNSGNLPREAAPKDAQMFDLLINQPASHDPVAADKPTTSLPMDVEGACNESQVPVQAAIDSPRHANDGPTATDSVTQPCGSPSENSVTSESGSDSSVKNSTLTDEDIQLYIPFIDKLLAAADREKVGSKEIRQGLEKELGRDLCNQKKAVKELIRTRFQVLESAPPAGSFDAGERGCPSPPHGSSPSDEHGKGKVAAGKINSPKAPKPQPVVIDLTDIPDDHKPLRSPSPIHTQSPKSPGNKRKRNDSASNSDAQPDRDDERDSRSLVKRRPTASHGPSLNLFERRSGRVLLILEEVKLRLSDGRQGLYSWDKSLRAWTGTLGVYKIGRPHSNDLGFVVWGKVRPIGLDALPVYISLTVGDQGETMVEGDDIDENTWEVSSGEFGDMLVDPFSRRYIGHVI